MKNKGFTLIELLAVIVILAIIALIAVPMVLNTIDKVKISSAEASATAYVKGVENSILNELIDGNVIEDGEYQYNHIAVNIKGTKPTRGTVVIENRNVSSAVLCVSDYKIEYKSNVAKKVSDNCDDMSISPDASKITYKTTYNSDVQTVEDALNDLFNKIGK